MANRHDTVYYRTSLLTREEKEKLVIELYKQEKTIREIAKEVRMSFSDIGAIIKREFGSDQSRDAQILKLFAKGTKPIEIAIKFNLSAHEVQRLHTEYRGLCGMHELSKIYDTLGDKIESFIQLYKAMSEHRLGSAEIINTVRYGKDIPILELKYEKVNSDVMEIEDRKQTLLSEIQDLEGTIEVSRNVINTMDQVLEQRRNEVKSLDCQKQNIADNIIFLMGSKEYGKIKDIARQQIETTLKDKRALLLIALAAVIEAFKLDPEKQILLSNVSTDGGYQPYNLEEQREQLLELAEQIHSELANDLMNATMNSTFDKQAVIPLP